MLNNLIKIAAVILTALSLSGCSFDQADSAKLQRDEVICAIGGESENGYDPIMGWGRYGSPLFQSTLLKRDEKLAIVNDLAVSYEVDATGQVWTVEIRRDARFSDGSYLTAQDVAFTFNQAARSGGLIDLTVLERAEALSPLRVRFSLKEPRSTFINRLVTLGIVPEKLYNRDYNQHPVGSGPYKLVRWIKGEQLIVERNPYYYGPRPAIGKVTFLFLDEDTALAAAKTGQVHVVAVPQTLANQQVPGMRLQAVKSVDNRGLMFPCVANQGRETEQGYPIGHDVTADPAIRRAINLAIDRQALVEHILEGYGSAAHGPVSHLPWEEPGARIKDNQPEKARQVLEQAGWLLDKVSGVRKKQGLTAQLTMLYPANDSVRQALALAAAQMINQIGIQVTVDGKNWEQIEQLCHSQVVLFGWGSHDPMEMVNLYHSQSAGRGFFNPGFYHNKKVDHYLEQGLASRSQDEANRYWRLAQWDGSTGFTAKGDAAWAWLVNLDHVYFVDEDLDIGQPQTEPHGHGWPITANITKWQWLPNRTGE